METRPLLIRLRDGLISVLLLGIGLRVVAEILTPVLPALGGLFCFAWLVYWLLFSGRSNRWNSYRRY